MTAIKRSTQARTTVIRESAGNCLFYVITCNIVIYKRRKSMTKCALDISCEYWPKSETDQSPVSL